MNESVTIKVKPSVKMMIHCEREIGESISDTISRVFSEYMKIQEAELTKQEVEMWKESSKEDV